MPQPGFRLQSSGVFLAAGGAVLYVRLKWFDYHSTVIQQWVIIIEHTWLHQLNQNDLPRPVMMILVLFFPLTAATHVPFQCLSWHRALFWLMFGALWLEVWNLRSVTCLFEMGEKLSLCRVHMKLILFYVCFAAMAYYRSVIHLKWISLSVSHMKGAVHFQYSWSPNKHLCVTWNSACKASQLCFPVIHCTGTSLSLFFFTE